MKTKLTRVGDSVALLLDEPLLEQLGLEEDAEVELSTSGDVLLMTPVRDAARQQKLREAITEMDSKYAEVFKRLAE